MTDDQPRDRNGDLTLREAELQLAAEQEWRAGHLREHELLADAHKEKHAAELEAVNKAEQSQQKAIDAALGTSERATDAQKGLVKSSLEDHHREHLTHEASHAREHTLVSEALSKAESAMDKRLEGIVSLFAERDKAYGERFDAVLRAITVIEKGDVKQEGRSLGQGATIAVIVGVVTFVGTVLGIIVLLANLTTAS
jgi:hypothetical protein